MTTDAPGRSTGPAPQEAPAPAPDGLAAAVDRLRGALHGAMRPVSPVFAYAEWAMRNGIVRADMDPAPHMEDFRTLWRDVWEAFAAVEEAAGRVPPPRPRE